MLFNIKIPVVAKRKPQSSQRKGSPQDESNIHNSFTQRLTASVTGGWLVWLARLIVAGCSGVGGCRSGGRWRGGGGSWTGWGAIDRERESCLMLHTGGGVDRYVTSARWMP